MNALIFYIYYYHSLKGIFHKVLFSTLALPLHIFAAVTVLLFVSFYFWLFHSRNYRANF